MTTPQKWPKPRETGIEPEEIFGVHGGVGTPEHLEKLRAISTR